ncbi:MAG: type I-E CRISPR-associated protein Cas6/Cse3/CasE [Chthonomonadales bacterium]|nr:type I-E CRISPR-associated protein Cas6/Cse3/CasE [Chthonomonadales bacterium]
MEVTAPPLTISAVRVPMESLFAATASMDFYEVHRIVTMGFPDRDAARAARILFRFDPEGEHGMLYVQTQAPPDWDRVRETLRLPVYGPVPLTLPGGERLRFRLLAKPSYRIGKRGSPDRGVRTTIDNEPEQREWLARKGEAAGFALEGCLVTERVWHDSKSPERLPNGSAKPLHGALFEGLLRVTDRERLRAAVAGGIGPQKAFGFGLLSLAPAEG